MSGSPAPAQNSRPLRPQVQATLQALTGTTLVDLHISDLLNKQLPSHFDYTSLYDLLVFRRLASGHGEPRPRRLRPASPRWCPADAAVRRCCGALTPARSASPCSTRCC